MRAGGIGTRQAGALGRGPGPSHSDRLLIGHRHRVGRRHAGRAGRLTCGAGGPSAAQSPTQLGDTPSPTPTVAWTISPAAVVYGQTVTAQGTVTPAAAGQTVTVAVDGATVATPVTDGTGAFSATFVATVGGTVSATLDDGTAGPPLTLTVVPKVTVKAGATLPWGFTRFTITVLPASYTGRVAATVSTMARRSAVAAGHPAAGDAGVEAAHARHRRVPGARDRRRRRRPCRRSAREDHPHRPLASRRRGLARALRAHPADPPRRARFRVPGISSRISVEAGDSIVAFQKAYGLPRTYVFAAADWRKLDVARLIKAKHKSPATHIEIDKTRQILMIVKGGKPYGIIPVSTGATGNTPVGRFHILRKAPSTSTWLGSAILWRTMDFYGHFAMHGYPEVPPYPASHGCVREPIWVANWTYVHSWVGETVYIHY